MIKSSLTILHFIFILSLSAQHHIQITVDSLPAEPGDYDLFIAGSFNNWNPADLQSQFQRKGNGQFYINLKLSAGVYEYKITRGSWKDVECRAGGADRENRVLKVSNDETFFINIAAWKDNFQDKKIKHTASPHVKIIDTAFWMPQLKRTRRVWIYLPEAYTNAKMNYRFPVLYIQDGQNVFDDATSYAGEWGLDEFLDSTKAKPCIVVAIDHGGNKRLNEYSPYDFSLTGIAADSGSNKGEGNLYVDFLATTLKYYIDKNYRTKKDKSHTFVAGSSMGGLISMYAVLKYPNVFGGAGVFSPAFWIAPKIFADIKSKGEKVNAYIYFYAGKQESERMVPDMLKVFNKMAAVSESKMMTVIRDEGRHNEPTWRKEFPLFYKWVYPQKNP